MDSTSEYGLHEYENHFAPPYKPCSMNNVHNHASLATEFIHSVVSYFYLRLESS